MYVFIFLVIFVIISAVLMKVEKTRSQGKKLFIISFTALALYSALSVWVFVLFLFPREWWCSYAAVIGVLTVLAAVIYLVQSEKRRKKVYISLFSAAVICFIPLAATAIYNTYIESIPTVGDGDDVLYYYAPYHQNSKVVTLPNESTLKISSDFPSFDGATALYPVYAAFAKAIYPSEVLSDEHVLVCTTTTTAYEKLIAGEVDMIFVASASKTQAADAAIKGVELTFTPIGREAFVFFVNAKNTLENITVEDIKGIYSGKITEWEELGVKRLGSIRAFQRDEGSGSQTALQKLMGDIPLMEPLIEDRIDGMGGIIRQTADYKNYSNSIGYSFRFYSTEMVKNNLIKLLSINGVYPSRENIINNTYPICASFYAVTTQNSNPLCDEIVKWILSEEGQYIIEQTGYVGVGN